MLSVSPRPAAQSDDTTTPVSYARQIRPMFELKCFECHDAQEREGDLELTAVASMLRGGKKAGAAIVPGKPDESPLIQYLTGERRPRMPKNYKPLTDDQIALVRRWIAAGAVDDSATAGAAAAETDPEVPQLLPSHEQPAQANVDLTSALYAGDNEQLLVLRRRLRLARLPQPPAPAPAYPGSTNPIDHFIAAGWREAGLASAAAPPPLVDDRGFVRRVYLDVIGVIPPSADVERFVADRTPGKRERLIDTLLARDDDYAAHWTPFWEEALGSQTTRLQGGIPTRGNYRPWIYDHFRRNTPYDVFVASLVDPLMPAHKKTVEADANGKKLRIGYVLNETHTDTIQTAANTAQVFLGTGMKCASCHNHFLNDEWPQARFLAFAGLFAPDDLEVIRCEKRTGQVVPARFPFALPEVPAAAPAGEEARLHRLALLLTDPANPRFARTIVNRLWKRYLGLGLFEPADDFRLDRQPSNPALLTWLAADFMRQGYDLKHTIRLILTSHTYQHRYDPALEDSFDVTAPDTPRYYRSPRLRRVTAEQFIDSLRVLTAQALDTRARVFLDNASTALTRALGKPASRNEISTARPDDAAVLQALELMNGPEVDHLVYGSDLADETGRVLADATATRSSVEAALDRLYRAALGRPPSPPERGAARAFIRDPRSRRDVKAARAGRDGDGPAKAGHYTNGPAKAGHYIRGEWPEEVWLEDDVPEGAKAEGSTGTQLWQWVEDAARVRSGTRAHVQEAGETDVSGHRVTELTPRLVRSRDHLFAWVFLDPARPPREIMLQWQADGEWEHRAYWADLERSERLPQAPTRRWMGPLPKPGAWIRLDVSAGDVGLGTPESAGVTGLSFDQVGGYVTWDSAGVRRAPDEPWRDVAGDMLWALVSSPEFQFIR
jgi:mono/diheme cytochrome c family protein